MTTHDMVLTGFGLRFQGTTYPCSVGKGGITRDKKEGDGATPSGIHRVVGILYRPDRMSQPTEWAVPIRVGDLWSDDPSAPDYNNMVRSPYLFSHERLFRADPLYDLVILTDWNWPVATPRRGSAIFIHQWRRPRFPTEGCLALGRTHLQQIARVITPETRLIIR
ncbi:MAG: L,D-transpeptidase family protein [Paracoccaceae bacterium]